MIARPFAPTLRDLASAFDWAYAYLEAYEAAPRAHSTLHRERRADCWLAMALLRMEIALLGITPTPDAADRVLRALKALERLGEADGLFQTDPRYLSAALQHWLLRAPDACDALVTQLREHTLGDIRYAVAAAAPTHRPVGIAALTHLARDGDDRVKQTALERLLKTHAVAFWQSAFAADPFAGQRPAGLKRLRGPVKVVCDAFAPRSLGNAQPPPPTDTDYAEALAALPTRLLLDHARAVLNATGDLHPRAPSTLLALGARPGTLDTVLALVEGWGLDHTFTRALEGYFRAVRGTAAAHRARCVLGLVRWAHRQEDPDRPSLQLWSLLHGAGLDALWPAGRSVRPWVDLVTELGAGSASTAVQESLKCIGTERLPKAFRARMLEAWTEDGDDGDETSLVAFFDHRGAAALLPARARGALVDRILTRRRSTTAMAWALEQRIEGLYVPRRDGPMPMFLQRLYADPGLRAVVLSSRELSGRFLELVRADLVAGRITRPLELKTAVAAIQHRSGDLPWYFFAQGEALIQATRAAEAAAAVPASAPVLTAAEWEAIRTLRPQALAAADGRLAFVLDLFPKTPWDDRDRADFLTLLNLALGDEVTPEDDDIDIVGYLLDREWHPDFVAFARRIAPALRGHYGRIAGHVHKALCARLDALVDDP